MEFTIFFLCFLFSFQLTKFSQSFHHSTKDIGLLLDVYFDFNEYYVLTEEKVLIGKYGDDEFIKDFSITSGASNISAIIKIGDYYGIACTQSNLLEYYDSLGHLKYNLSYTSETFDQNNFKCSIDKVGSNYIVVGHVNSSSDHYSFDACIFQKDSGNNLIYKGVKSISNEKIENSFPTIRCIGLTIISENKVMCIFLSNTPFYFIFDVTSGEEVESQQLTNKQYLQLKIVQSSPSKYLICGINPEIPDDYGYLLSQYHMPFLLKNTTPGYEIGKEEIVTEVSPVNVFSYSGYAFNTTMYYALYVGMDDKGTMLNVEKVGIGPNYRNVTEAYDFIIDADPDLEDDVMTFTTVYTKGDIEFIHVLTQGIDNTNIYIFRYPQTIKCANDTIHVKTNATGNYVISKVIKSFPRDYNDYDIYDISKIASSPISDGIAYYSLVGKKKFKNEEEIDHSMVFSLNESGLNYYYNHDCNVSIKLCHDFCDECENVPEEYNKNPSNCTNKSCRPYYAYLSDMDSDCYLNTSTVKGYAIEPTDKKVFNKCYQTCDTCKGDQVGDETKHNCLTCKSGYVGSPDGSSDNGKFCIICLESYSNDKKWIYDREQNDTHCIDKKQVIVLQQRNIIYQMINIVQIIVLLHFY